MRHFTKILVGMGAFLLMAGGLLALSGWAMGAETRLDLDWAGGNVHISHGGITVSDHNLPLGPVEGHGGARKLKPFTDMDIDVSMADIVFQEAEDYGVALDWHYDGMEMQYQVVDGRLTVWNTSHGFDSGRGDDLRAGRVVVYLPPNAVLGKLYLADSMAAITLKDRTIEELTVSNSMGGVMLSGLTVKRLELENAMGELKAQGCTVTDSLTASNDMAGITLSGDLRGEIVLENSMGIIDLSTSTPVEQFGYDLSTSMATVTVNGKKSGEEAVREGGEYTLSADNSMGEIRVSFGR